MTTKQIEVTRSAVSRATQAEIFALLSTGSTWPAWSPISSFRLDPESPDGEEEVGTVRVFSTGIFSSSEEIVRIESPTVFGYKLLQSSTLHVRDYQAEVRLAPHVDGTLITWSGSFHTLFPGSGWIWRRIISRLYRQFSEGLATYADQLDSDDRSGG